ncbi:MAG: hypothetical protein D6772_05460, partial [Bacteroidetes bacterium]
MRPLYIFLLCLLASYIVAAQNPAWTPPDRTLYSASHSVMVKINLAEQDVAGQPNDQLAFFIDGELRGLSSTGDIYEPGFTIHYATIYSNSPFGRPIAIQYYDSNTGIVYDARTTFNFVNGGQFGTFDMPETVFIGEEPDIAISLAAVPDQHTLQGIPFSSIDLEPFLIQSDADPVIWSVTSAPGATAGFTGSMLNVSVDNPGFTGTIPVAIQALEDTDNQYSANTVINYVVGERYAGPRLDVILPMSIALPTVDFEPFDLDDYESTYGGNCLTYTYRAVLDGFYDNEDRPNLQMVRGAQTMSYFVQPTFTDNYVFDHPDDLLYAVINGEVRGEAEPIEQFGQRYFALNVSNNGGTPPIEIYLYSGALRSTLRYPIPMQFNSGGQVGSFDAPAKFDFSPLAVSVGPDGV